MVKNKVEELINHLNSGGTIVAQSTNHTVIRMKEEGCYFIACENEGCCDNVLNREELLENWLKDELLVWKRIR